jgi:hypothetical protein
MTPLIFAACWNSRFNDIKSTVGINSLEKDITRNRVWMSRK